MDEVRKRKKFEHKILIFLKPVPRFRRTFRLWIWTCRTTRCFQPQLHFRWFSERRFFSSNASLTVRFGPKKDVFGPPTAPTQPNVRTCETACVRRRRRTLTSRVLILFVSQPTSRLMNVVLYVERRESASREYNQRVCQVTLTEEVRNSILRPQNGGKKKSRYIYLKVQVVKCSSLFWDVNWSVSPQRIVLEAMHPNKIK